MIYLIVIPVDHVEVDLSVRHTLVDTIEARGIGQVVEEGTGMDGMEVVMVVEDGRAAAAKTELRSLLRSLGLGGAVVTGVEE